MGEVLFEMRGEERFVVTSASAVGNHEAPSHPVGKITCVVRVSLRSVSCYVRGAIVPSAEFLKTISHPFSQTGLKA